LKKFTEKAAINDDWWEGLLREILRQINLSKDDYEKLRK